MQRQQQLMKDKPYSISGIDEANGDTVIDDANKHQRARERLDTLLFYRATTGLDAKAEVELKALLKVYPEVSLSDYETIAAAMDVALTKNTRFPLALGKVLAQDIADETKSMKPRADHTPMKELPMASVKTASTVEEIVALKPPPNDDKQIKTGMKAKIMHTANLEKQGYTYRFNTFLMSFLGLLLFSGIIMWWWFERPALNYNLSHHQTMQEERSLLVQKTSSEALIHERWLHTINPLTSKVQGDIVWSATEQKGYMRFSGLPVTRQGYYELWLYDYTQADHKPVLGKRFEIEQSRRETIIPFAPDTEVKKPYKFVVTLEQNENYRSVGRSQILLMAQP